MKFQMKFATAVAVIVLALNGIGIAGHRSGVSQVVATTPTWQDAGNGSEP